MNKIFSILILVSAVTSCGNEKVQDICNQYIDVILDGSAALYEKQTNVSMTPSVLKTSILLRLEIRSSTQGLGFISKTQKIFLLR